MNLITCTLIVWVVLDCEINLIFGAYKKKKNEHCSLQVNSLCYDDELNDKPLKIVHDENGVKVADATSEKKSRKKSTDVLQAKVSRQLSWDLPKLFTRLNSAPKYGQQTSTNEANKSQINKSKLIFEFHKLDDSSVRFLGSPNSMQVDPSTNTPYSPMTVPTLSPLGVHQTLPSYHLNRFNTFKNINKPLLASSSFHNSAFFANSPILKSKKFNYPLASSFSTSTYQVPNHFTSSPLLTKSSSYYSTYNAPKLVSNYLPKYIGSKEMPKNLVFKATTTTPSTTTTLNYWLPNYLTSGSNAQTTEPLPTDLTNYINLRESGKLHSINQTNYVHNTTQDRIWHEDEQMNDVFPTKSSFDFDSTSRNNNSRKSAFNDKFQFENSAESGERTIRPTVEFGTPHTENLFSTEESSREEFDTFKLANQLDNDPKEIAKDNRDNYFASIGKKEPSSSLNEDSREKEFSLNEKFETTQPLNHHDWPTQLDHQIDNILTNGKVKSPVEIDKSAINYLTDDEHKENLLANQNYPIFYPVKGPNNPAYTIVQSKDKNNSKWKRYAKLFTKLAVEEAKKFKKNELDTFLRRKKLIIDRYRPNDMYQKAIAARYVWKKVSLDFLSLLGYQIANYLEPVNSKNRMKHSNLFNDKLTDEQLAALQHVLKDQPLYYQTATSLHTNKYLPTNSNQHTLEDNVPLSSHLMNDEFLKDDSFFNQNYFKIQDDSIFTQSPKKLDEPLTASSLTSEETRRDNAFELVQLKKDHHLDREFMHNQMLNNKLLADQLLSDKLIDFRTKEQLQQVIKPIKIIQSD